MLRDQDTEDEHAVFSEWEKPSPDTLTSVLPHIYHYCTYKRHCRTHQTLTGINAETSPS